MDKKFPKVIGIRFTDNDFHNTLRPFLLQMAEHGFENYGNDKRPFSKELVIDLFRRCAGALYILCQNGLSYNFEHINQTTKYLETKPIEVYFDDEVKKFITDNNGWFNGEFFVVDTQAHGGPHFYTI